MFIFKVRNKYSGDAPASCEIFSKSLFILALKMGIAPDLMTS